MNGLAVAILAAAYALADFTSVDNPQSETTEPLVPVEVPHQNGAPAHSPSEVELDGRIDLLVLYPPRTGANAAAVATANAAMRTALQMAVDNFNSTVEFSLPGVTPRPTLNLVAAEDMANLPNNLEALGSFAPLATRRTATGADIVVVIHAQPMTGADTTDGIAFTYCRSPSAHRDRAIALVKEKQINEVFTMVHEIGHLFGANHDIAAGRNGNPNEQPTNCMYNDSSYGHSMFVTEPDGRLSHYGTIMAYRGVRQRVFSNPNVMFRGVPSGSRNANNALAITDSYRIIANYSPPNDAARLRARRRNDGPAITVVAPATTPVRARLSSLLTVSAQSTDTDGVAGAELVWWEDGRGKIWSCPLQSDAVDPRDRDTEINRRVGAVCLRNGDTFTWTVRLPQSGSVSYRIRSFDMFGTYTLSPIREVTLQ